MAVYTGFHGESNGRVFGIQSTVHTNMCSLYEFEVAIKLILQAAKYKQYFDISSTVAW
jgi:hypothetical protein